MSLAPEDAFLRETLAAARAIEPSTHDVDEVISRLGDRRSSRRLRPPRSAPMTWIATVAVVAGVIAVPPVRAALGDLADAFSGYFSGDDSDAPGRSIQASDTPPDWLAFDGRTDQRLLAADGSYELYVTRQPSGAFGFALGDSVGITDSGESWERQFEENAAVILGTEPRIDERGMVPIYGVAAGNVDRVELRYDHGSPTDAPAETGGFVVLAEAGRQPRELAVLDADGHELQSLDLDYIGWSALTG